MPTTLQLTPQQLQQFGFQQFQPTTQHSQQQQQQQPQQIQIQQQIFSPHTLTTPTATTTTTTLQTNTTASQTQTTEEPEDDGEEVLLEVSTMEVCDDVDIKPTIRMIKAQAAPRKKNPPASVVNTTPPPTTSTATKSFTTAGLTQIPKHQSHLASKQLDAIAAHKDPSTPAKAVSVNEQQQQTEEQFSLTKCEVCEKMFKKKEHLMQHLKTHIVIYLFIYLFI
jgi:hypothetical protein